jgi:hypothetical protein
MNIKPSHWIAIAGQLVTLATMIGGLEHGWQDALTPTFVSGVVMQVGTLIIALCGDPIQGRTVLTEQERREIRAKQAETV